MRVTIAVVWVVACFSGYEARADRILQNNPFDQPARLEPGAVIVEPEPESIELTLRGVMLGASKARSLANVGGEIARIGDVLDGYTLLDIEERRVVLGKGQARVVLTLDEEDE